MKSDALLKRLPSVAAAILLVTATILCLPPTRSALAESRLDGAEVRTFIVGHRLKGPYGIFHFKTNGTYTYKSKGKLQGPVTYQIYPNGKVNSEWGYYYFYKLGRKSHQYMWSGSGRKRWRIKQIN